MSSVLSLLPVVLAPCVWFSDTLQYRILNTQESAFPHFIYYFFYYFSVVYYVAASWVFALLCVWLPDTVQYRILDTQGSAFSHFFYCFIIILVSSIRSLLPDFLVPLRLCFSWWALPASKHPWNRLVHPSFMVSFLVLSDISLFPVFPAPLCLCFSWWVLNASRHQGFCPLFLLFHLQCSSSYRCLVFFSLLCVCVSDGNHAKLVNTPEIAFYSLLDCLICTVVGHVAASCFFSSLCSCCRWEVLHDFEHPRHFIFYFLLLP